MNLQEKNLKINNKGITLIALVITVIIILILASITISTLSGKNGIINETKNAKKNTEIAGEKEVIELSTIQAMRNNKYGDLQKAELEDALNQNAGINKTEVLEDNSNFIVKFIESNRYYSVDDDGNISDFELIIDNTPGDITKDKDGNDLDGIEKPFEIWSIEDLVTFSNMTNGSGYKLVNGNPIEITNSDSLAGKKVTLKKNLDFKSDLSYLNSKRTDFGDINGNADDGNQLKTEMTTGSGFKPISGFSGSFDGENHELRNFFIDSELDSALFVGGNINVIRNLGITGKITSTGNYSAGIVSAASVSLMENCYNKAEINGSSSFLAGLAAKCTPKITTNCYNTGNVTNTHSTGNTGGLICDLGGGIIENCYNTGNISNDGWYCGGIASGHANGRTTIKNCYNTGNISGHSSSGGIIGVGADIIENCYNTGNIVRKPICRWNCRI